MTKKVCYLELLKEAITEYDASQLDYKGPLINPILTFDGSTELKSNEPNTDVASVLERYYYKEQAEEGLSVPEDEKNELKTGETPDAIAATKADIEKEVAEETTGAAGDDITDATREQQDVGPEAKAAGGDEGSETGAQAGLEVGKNEEDAKDADVAGAVSASEQAVIEKLIEEMEEDTLKEDVPGGLGAIGKSKEAERDYKLEQAFSIFKEQIETMEEEPKEEEPEEELDVDEELPEEEASEDIGEEVPSEEEPEEDESVEENLVAEEDELDSEEEAGAEEEIPEEEDAGEEEVASKEVVA